MAVKFVSYTYPPYNLCKGELTIEVNGKTYTLEKGALYTSGSCYETEDGNYETYQGDWKLYDTDLPVEIRAYMTEILEVVNNNVEHGCCGGCM
jgi:hypothetical protein